MSRRAPSRTPRRVGMPSPRIRVPLPAPAGPPAVPQGLAPPPAPFRGAPLQADLRREYVASGGWGWTGQFARTLPPYIDDVTAIFGADLYARMRLNPIIGANLDIRRGAIASGGLSAQPPVTKEDPAYAEAERIARFVQYTVDNLDTPFTTTLFEMLLALLYGNKCAELIWELGPPVDPTVSHDQLYLRAIRPKPAETVAFVMDAWMRLLGVAYTRPGAPLPGVLDLARARVDAREAGTPDPLLPPEKFWILTYRGENGDPRGHSLARPAYFAWWALEQVWNAYLKFLARFAEPTLAGFTDPEADLPDPLPDGTVITPEEAMLSKLVQMVNGASGAFPGKARLEVVESHGDGAAFRTAITALTSDITRALTGQQLMTEVQNNMTRAASSVHQDVFGIAVRVDKAMIAADIRHQIYRPIVRYNYGEAAARRFTPVASLGATEHQDFPAYASAIARLMHEGGIYDDQLPGIWALLGLPPGDPTRGGVGPSTPEQPPASPAGPLAAAPAPLRGPAPRGAAPAPAVAPVPPPPAPGPAGGA